MDGWREYKFNKEENDWILIKKGCLARNLPSDKQQSQPSVGQVNKSSKNVKFNQEEEKGSGIQQEDGDRKRVLKAV